MFVRMSFVACVLACVFCRVAYGGSSFVVSDGLNRAPAVTLHCLTGSVALPCGTTGLPLVVAPVSGGALASNQNSEIALQQALSTALGSQSDAAYSSGNGSSIALLKALLAALTNGTTALPAGGQPVSRSVTIIGMQSTQLFSTNSGRHYLGFQVPAAGAIWVNFVGGAAAPNAVDCISLPAGTVYESGSYVIRGAISVYSPVSASISAWEG